MHWLFAQSHLEEGKLLVLIASRCASVSNSSKGSRSARLLERVALAPAATRRIREAIMQACKAQRTLAVLALSNMVDTVTCSC